MRFSCKVPGISERTRPSPQPACGTASTVGWYPRVIILCATLATVVAQPIGAQTSTITPDAISNNAQFARLKITGFDGTRYIRPQRRGFSASEILDIEFSTRLFRSTKGIHLLELKLYTPNGHLYQVLTVLVAVDTGNPKQSVIVEAFPKPMAPQALETNAKPEQKRYVVTASLPVAGTFITTNSLYGRWEIEAFLDGKRLRLKGDRSFIVRR